MITSVPFKNKTSFCFIFPPPIMDVVFIILLLKKNTHFMRICQDIMINLLKLPTPFGVLNLKNQYFNS